MGETYCVRVHMKGISVHRDDFLKAETVCDYGNHLEHSSNSRGIDVDAKQNCCVPSDTPGTKTFFVFTPTFCTQGEVTGTTISSGIGTWMTALEAKGGRDICCIFSYIANILVAPNVSLHTYLECNHFFLSHKRHISSIFTIMCRPFDVKTQCAMQEFVQLSESEANRCSWVYSYDDPPGILCREDFTIPWNGLICSFGNRWCQETTV